MGIDKDVLPQGVDMPGGIQSKERRRIYDYDSRQVTDIRLGRKFIWQGVIEHVLAEALDAYLDEKIKSLLGKEFGKEC